MFFYFGFITFWNESDFKIGSKEMLVKLLVMSLDALKNVYSSINKHKNNEIESLYNAAVTGPTTCYAN